MLTKSHIMKALEKVRQARFGHFPINEMPFPAWSLGATVYTTGKSVDINRTHPIHTRSGKTNANKKKHDKYTIFTPLPPKKKKKAM